MLLVILLKLGFDRPHPGLLSHSAYIYLVSFSIGHSKLSAVTCLNPRRSACTKASSAKGEGLPDAPGDAFDFYRGDQSSVSRGALADGRLGRLGGRGMGAALLGGGGKTARIRENLTRRSSIMTVGFKGGKKPIRTLMIVP